MTILNFLFLFIVIYYLLFIAIANNGIAERIGIYLLLILLIICLGCVVGRSYIDFIISLLMRRR